MLPYFWNLNNDTNVNCTDKENEMLWCLFCFGEFSSIYFLQSCSFDKVRYTVVQGMQRKQLGFLFRLFTDIFIVQSFSTSVPTSVTDRSNRQFSYVVIVLSTYWCHRSGPNFLEMLTITKILKINSTYRVSNLNLNYEFFENWILSCILILLLLLPLKNN